MKISRNYYFWGATFVGLLLDRLTKLWVVTQFELTDPADTWELWPNVFHFTYVVNPGAAFSILPGWFGLRWISLLVSVALVIVGLKVKNLHRWDQVGFGFLLSGAAGNGVDRFLEGHVVDFLDFRLINFPIFNVADIFINVGIICLLMGAWSQSAHPKSS